MSSVGHAFERVIGIVGHPTTPDVAWSDQQMIALREIGIETLQLSIAWAWRPADEVLNLEHLDDPTNAREWKRRIVQARTYGFRTLAHFGIPVGEMADATTCILDPEVRTGYADRLRWFLREFPGVDEVMIYTYDQRAWLCSEFGDCPRCHGIPLHERLPGFLHELIGAMQQAQPGMRLWWEPWELSAGQTYAVVQQMNPDNFGLILHNSIAEVQFVNTTDLWFRNLARLAASRGIAVVGEGFFGGSGEDIHPLTHLACPRLVYQELDALWKTVGVVGVKEYYGLTPSQFSVNIALFKAYMQNPDSSLATLLAPIAAQYGHPAEQTVLAAWEATSQAMELFPWDASWALRRVFDESPSREWERVPTASWMTPSWQANRRGFYLVTDEQTQHPWLREDVGLRAALASDTFTKAAELYRQARSIATAGQDDLSKQEADCQRAGTISGRLGQSLLSHRHQ